MYDTPPKRARKAPHWQSWEAREKEQEFKAHQDILAHSRQRIVYGVRCEGAKGTGGEGTAGHSHMDWREVRNLGRCPIGVITPEVRRLAEVITKKKKRATLADVITIQIPRSVQMVRLLPGTRYFQIPKFLEIKTSRLARLSISADSTSAADPPVFPESAKLPKHPAPSSASGGGSGGSMAATETTAEVQDKVSMLCKAASEPAKMRLLDALQICFCTTLTSGTRVESRWWNEIDASWCKGCDVSLLVVGQPKLKEWVPTVSFLRKLTTADLSSLLHTPPWD